MSDGTQHDSDERGCFARIERVEEPVEIGAHGLKRSAAARGHASGQAPQGGDGAHVVEDDRAAAKWCARLVNSGAGWEHPRAGGDEPFKPELL